MSNRVDGIMLLVGAGLALPNQTSDPEKGAASSAPTIQIPEWQIIHCSHHSLKSPNLSEARGFASNPSTVSKSL